MANVNPAVRRNPQAGQSLVLAAFVMTSLLAMLGFGIDFGYLRYSKRQMQSLADAAAVAAALQIPTCGTSPGCSSLTNAAKSALVNDNSVPSTSVTASTNCTNSPALGDTVIVVNNPPSCLPKGNSFPANDPNNGNNNFAEALVFQNRPTFFSRVFGINSMQMVARAEAQTGNGSNCTYALDPTGSGAITLALGAVTNACGVVDESNNGSAFTCFLGIFQAPYIGVHGGDGFPFCLFPGASPKTGITNPNPGDPLQYLQASLASQAPAPGTCSGLPAGNVSSGTHTGSTGHINITGTVTLNPSTYCGGITVAPGANLTFNPGIYTLTSTTTTNGGLQINAGTNVTGNGVGFYNDGPHGAIQFLCSSCTAGTVVLTAPNATNCGSCGAAWQGMLFYQDPGDTATSTVVGSINFNTKPTGTSYFPNADVLYAFDISVNYNILVAKDITMGLAWNGNAINTTFFNDYTELTNGSPIKGGAALVE